VGAGFLFNQKNYFSMSLNSNQVVGTKPQIIGGELDGSPGSYKALVLSETGGITQNAHVVDCSFTKTGPGLVADEAVQVGPTGSGMTVAQAYGNLLVDTGTTANAEFLMRSVESIKGGHIARVKVQLSQKIVNQHFGIYLADLIGENCAFTTDATGLLISITLPAGHGFTDANIGQSCMLGGGGGAAVIVSGRYAITAVAGDVVTFSPVFACTWSRSTTTATITFLGGNPIFSIAESATVSASSDTLAIVNGVVSLLTQSSGGVATFTCLNAGATSGTLTLTMSGKAWTPSAAGTVTVFGWNCVSLVKNGTSATTTNWFDSQRRGWGSGATSLTLNTDASPGDIIQFSGDTTSEFLCDSSPATSTTILFTSRASRLESLIDALTPVYLFMQVFNGVTAPASTTRLTVGKFSMEETGINKVLIGGVSATGSSNGQRVVVDSGTLIVTVASSGIGVVGTAAEDSAASGNPVSVGGQARTGLPASSIVNGDAVRLTQSISGQAIVKNFAVRELDFAVNQTVTTNAQTAIRAAQGTSIRQNITAIKFQNTNATATTLTIQDGSTTLDVISVPASMTLPMQVTYPTPLFGTGNAALNYTAGTTGANILLQTTGFNSY
jgi:hypothetical protein